MSLKQAILPSHYDKCLKWITLQNGRVFYGTLSIGGEAYGVYIRKYYYPMPRCSCPFVFTEPLTVCVPQQYWLVPDGKWRAIGGWEKQNLHHSTLLPLVLWCDANQCSQVSAFVFIDCHSLGNALGSTVGQFLLIAHFVEFQNKPEFFLGQGSLNRKLIAN